MFQIHSFLDQQIRDQMGTQSSCVTDSMVDTSHHEEFSSIGTQTQQIKYVNASTQTIQPLQFRK